LNGGIIDLPNECWDLAAAICKPAQPSPLSRSQLFILTALVEG
jgi:hypothetical protein